MLKLLKQGKKSKWNFLNLKGKKKKPTTTNQYQPESFQGRGAVGDIPSYLPAPFAADTLSD